MEKIVFTDSYQKRAAFIEELLGVSVDEGAPLSAAMRYGLLGGGKRLRGVLSSAVAELLNCATTAIRSSIVATEMIHAASLIHDDLPALDGDDLRRGRPTCHRVYGEGFSLLAGDALIARALQVILNDDNLSVASRVALGSELASTVQLLCNGQALDLLQTGQPLAEITPSEVRHRHQLKTGALFSFCVVAPVIIKQFESGSLLPDCPLSLEDFKDFGVQFGLLFQIADDILGASASTSELGKRAGIDEARGVGTFVSLYGLDGARLQANQVQRTLLSMLEPFGSRADFVSALCKFALERRR